MPASGGLDVVCIARHGQTEWNVEGRRQGRLDSPLTALGREQAHRIASLARAHEVDGVFASPAGRTRTTAAIVAADLGRSVVVVGALAEVDHGDCGGLMSAEIAARFPDEWAARAAGKYEWRFPGGESYRDAYDRAGVALDQVAARGARRPLLVTHEMLARVLFMALLDLAPEDALARSLPFGTVLVVDPAGGGG